MELSSPKIRKFLILLSLSPQKFSLKIFLYFFLKKIYSGKVSYIFSKKAFQETELSYIFLKKFFFLIFRERYIQNPGIFRTRSIFRTLVY